jgi:DNA-binding LacI/PurR family transcriptional regulator
MATIREVARLAGVSPATVSRVMNGTAKVDEEKQQRVWQAIEETGFQPNELARALFKKSSRLVGLLVPNIENPFFSELARAIEEEAYSRGYHILLCSSDNNADKEQMNISMFSKMKADGVIIITNGDHTEEMISSCDLPVIVVDRHLKECGEIAFIESDHYKGGRLAAQCLVDCGCRNIVCLRGPQNFTSGVQRFQGYQDVCRENGMEIQYIDTAYSFEAGHRSAMELLQRYPQVDGILAANDMVAISVYKLLRSRGIRVPEDVQLVGFDDILFSRLVSPELTTIRQPVKEMGRRAVDIIYRYVNGEPFESQCVFDVELVERETTRRRD